MLVQNNKGTISKIIDNFAAGKPVILFDDRKEYEGDVILAGEFVSTELFCFLINEAGGIPCVAISEEVAKRLKIDLLPRRFADNSHAHFASPVDARSGISSGTSAHDRAYTIRLMASQSSSGDDFLTPGHVTTLIADRSGVLGRGGHTEACIELCRASKLTEVAVTCEIMNKDGSMASYEDLCTFSRRHDIFMSTIGGLIEYTDGTKII